MWPPNYSLARSFTGEDVERSETGEGSAPRALVVMLPPLRKDYSSDRSTRVVLLLSLIPLASSFGAIT
jgi:hypothetical protein